MVLIRGEMLIEDSTSYTRHVQRAVPFWVRCLLEKMLSLNLCSLSITNAEKLGTIVIIIIIIITIIDYHLRDAVVSCSSYFCESGKQPIFTEFNTYDAFFSIQVCVSKSLLFRLRLLFCMFHFHLNLNCCNILL